MLGSNWYKYKIKVSLEDLLAGLVLYLFSCPLCYEKRCFSLPLSLLQVDAGSNGHINPDRPHQLQRLVLLLLRHRLLWTVVADLLSQRPGMSQNTGRPQCAHGRISHSTQRIVKGIILYIPTYIVSIWMFVRSGSEWFGSLHHMDIHRFSHQLLIGSPPVGRG